MRFFRDGLRTGLFLQLAVGPVFFLLLGITLDSGFLSGFSGVVGATVVDFMYIALSIVGVGTIIEKSRHKEKFNAVSNVVLVAFGIFFVYKGINSYIDLNHAGEYISPSKSFVISFIMTITSPLSIIYWTSIFTTAAFEKNYKNMELVKFGAGAGSMTLIFLGSVMFLISRLGQFIPGVAVQLLNIAVGVVIMIYGSRRVIAAARKTAAV